MADHAREATASIPYPYRLTLTTLEPLIAFGGVLQALAAPESYLSTMTRGTVPYDPGTHFLYTQLAGSWLLFVFLMVFALRRFDDVGVWRWVCAGGLLQDGLFVWSVAESVGGWGVWRDVRGWGGSDWLVFWTSVPGLLARVLVVLGVGVKEGVEGGKGKAKGKGE